jgi:3-deoxy-D-manno-octulosonic-acid transferase
MTMSIFYKFLYNGIIVPSLWMILQSARLFNAKVRRGVSGRRNLFKNLEEALAKLPDGKPRFWFHSSSLGEFEQAKPIIAELKRITPEAQIIVSFFSPSGYEPSKKYRLADIITYIPFDSWSNARRFVRIVRPTAAIMVRYDVWPNHIWQLARADVPVFLANATMRPTTKRLIPGVRNFHSMIYGVFRSILTVTQTDAEMYNQFDLHDVPVRAIGDTRFDQVLIRRTEAESKHLLPPQITARKKIIVFGSSWESDEEVLVPVCTKLQHEEPALLMVLVPHEPTLENIERIESMLNGQMTHIRFSSLIDYNKQRIIIVDSIGVLVALYKYAHVAYVGGGFKSGVHNVLEPAVYGIPVVYGPRHQNSQEAVMLVKEKAGYVVEDDKKMYKVFRRLLEEEKVRMAAGKRAASFVHRNAGATQRFLTSLYEYLPGKIK